ncbi:MAG: response regulator transcription factor [Deltaproteobacteria bacterium]|nr:response regulator transcription factor [Deltaproteobacteria bacterium]
MLCFFFLAHAKLANVVCSPTLFPPASPCRSFCSSLLDDLLDDLFRDSLKDTDRTEFIKIIQQTYAGKIPSSPYLAHIALEPQAKGKPLRSPDQITRFAEKYDLTDLDLKVLRLVSKGLSNEEISDIVNLARETIKGHLKSLFRKLDVKNRTKPPSWRCAKESTNSTRLGP